MKLKMKLKIVVINPIDKYSLRLSFILAFFKSGLRLSK